MASFSITLMDLLIALATVTIANAYLFLDLYLTDALVTANPGNGDLWRSSYQSLASYSISARRVAKLAAILILLEAFALWLELATPMALFRATVIISVTGALMHPAGIMAGAIRFALDRTGKVPRLRYCLDGFFICSFLSSRRVSTFGAVGLGVTSVFVAITHRPIYVVTLFIALSILIWVRKHHALLSRLPYALS